MAVIPGFDYDYVFSVFHKPIKAIHTGADHAGSIYPSIEEQYERIGKLSGTACSFGLMVDTTSDTISPVDGLRYPFGSEINDRLFCKHVHPNYLISFLVFARFAYEILQKTQVSREHIFSGCYSIPVPLKPPVSNQYQWYQQVGYAVSVDENNRVLKHLNLYHLERACLPLAGGEIENRLAESSILVENQLHPVFEAYLRESVNDFLKRSLEKQPKKRQMLELLKQENTLSNRDMALMLKLKEETIKSYNKDLLLHFKAILGYQFVTLREGVAALTMKGYL